MSVLLNHFFNLFLSLSFIILNTLIPIVHIFWFEFKRTHLNLGSFKRLHFYSCFFFYLATLRKYRKIHWITHFLLFGPNSLGEKNRCNSELLIRWIFQYCLKNFKFLLQNIFKISLDEWNAIQWPIGIILYNLKKC